jgi:hypothetical protein
MRCSQSTIICLHTDVALLCDSTPDPWERAQLRACMSAQIRRTSRRLSSWRSVLPYCRRKHILPASSKRDLARDTMWTWIYTEPICLVAADANCIELHRYKSTGNCKYSLASSVTRYVSMFHCTVQNFIASVFLSAELRYGALMKTSDSDVYNFTEMKKTIAWHLDIEGSIQGDVLFLGLPRSPDHI